MSDQYLIRTVIETVYHGDPEEAFQAAFADANELANTQYDGSHILVCEASGEHLGGSAGVFCSGCESEVFPGIRWPTSTNDDNSREWVERCDVCKRYPSDRHAYNALLEIYGDEVGQHGFAVPAGLESLRPHLQVG